VLRGGGHAALTAPDPALGNRFAMATGLSWALTVSGLRWLGRSGAENAAFSAVAAGNLMAFLLCLPMVLPIAAIHLADLLVLLYLGIFQIGLAYFFVALAIREVPAFEATALLLLEPALNPVWAWIIHHEQPGAEAIAGGAIILGATLVNAWWQSRASPPKADLGQLS
jgi:drug/metabolite transporter, DME family